MSPVLTIRSSLITLLFTILIASPSAYGQISADTSSYFPLSVGNSWTYIEVLDPPHAPNDTLDGGTFAVTSRFAIHDTLYYEVDYPFALADTVRCAENGNIWARADGEAVLLFDFAIEDGATYTFESGGFDYDVHVEHRGVVEVSAGRFEDAITLGFDVPEMFDEEVHYTFAKGTGIISASGQMGQFVQLHEATVYPILDLLDWHGYFPLEIGTRWQYEFESWNSLGYGYTWIEDWSVVGDSLVNGTEYAVVELVCDTVSATWKEEPPPCNPDLLGQKLLRYDEESANVVELRWHDDTAEEVFLFQYDFELDAPFHYDDTPDGALATAYEYTLVEGGLTIGEEEVTAPQKEIYVYSSVPGSATFAHGIGLVWMSFEEHGGQSRRLTYARVGDRTYGAYQPVDRERPIDAAADVSLASFPNPTGSLVQIAYSVPSTAAVELALYDAVGRRVLRTDRGRRPGGSQQIELELSDVAAGVYSLVLIVDGSTTASTPIVIAR